MPERCTCGAQLPEDALFCHKCGKPQREILSAAEPEPITAPPPIPAASAEPLVISFHNGPAVRIALGVGFLAFVCIFILGRLPAAQALTLVSQAAAGFLAVFLYRRHTGQRLSMANGARLGWISGIFGFVIATILLTLMVVALSEPSAVATMREQMKTSGAPDGTFDQLVKVFHSPADLAGLVGATFLLFTILPAFGGAIGAKLLNRD